MSFKVVEKFVSINGEGTHAGKLAAFIRFAGCNLRCSFCDTKWANDASVSYEEMEAEEIMDYIKSTKVACVTLTGGEPLLQKKEDLESLILLLDEANLYFEFETNGSVYLKDFASLRQKCKHPENFAFTMDYKLIFSNMNEKMCTMNFPLLESQDTVKFVAGSIEDLNLAKKVMEEHQLHGKCNLYFSPVFGAIEPADIVDYMIENNLLDVTMQLQMHKFIWDPDKRGV